MTNKMMRGMYIRGYLSINRKKAEPVNKMMLCILPPEIQISQLQSIISGSALYCPTTVYTFDGMFKLVVYTKMI